MSARAFRIGPLLLLLATATIPRPASAALRSPQIPVLGSVLQDYLTSMFQVIDVRSQQDATQSWSVTTSTNTTWTVQFELGRKQPGVAVGLYNSGDISPALYQLFPAEAAAGWFCVASFRTSPARVIVNLFDELAAIESQTVYLGVDRAGYGVYMNGPFGVFYSQDGRNPNASAQFLVYPSNGMFTGGWWIAGEATLVSGSGSDQDFADMVVFYELPSCICEVQRTSWSTLKSRFR